MHFTRVPFLLALPMFLAGCEGPAGADGTNGADGVDGVDGVDGTNGTDGTAVLTGSIGPGESLTLEHGLGAGDKFYEAQFVWGGVVYDHSDYPMLRPGHLDTGTSFGASGLDSLYGDLSAALLASGDLVVVNRGWIEADDAEAFSIDIRSWDGTLVTHVDLIETDLADDDGYSYAYDPVLVALGDGGFALFYESYSYDYNTYENLNWIQATRYDASGTLVSDTRVGSPTDTRLYYSANAVSLADGGAMVCTPGWDEDDYASFAEVHVWEADGTQSMFEIADVDGSYCRIAELSDGSVALGVERRLTEDAPDGLDVVFAERDGTINAEVRVNNSYVTDDLALVAGSQGTLLVAAESGGPDLPFYAVLRDDGTVIQPATGMSGWENDTIQAAAFADGDFFILVHEDDSIAPMTWVVGAQGTLLRPMVIGDITGVPDDDLGAFFAGEGNTVGHLSPSYESEVDPYLSTYTKGLLQLRVDSDDAVSLHNETPDTLDVTLVAHRTP